MDDLYRTLIRAQHKYGFDLQVPRLVLLGAESAGKTSLLEYLLGYSVAFKQGGTATRCPTMLTLKGNEALGAGVRRITANDESVEARGLANYIKGHMARLGDGFSDEPMQIVVEAAGIPDLVIFDLPGLIVNPPSEPKAQRNAEQVARMAARYVRDPQNILLVVSKCKERVTSLDEIPMVDDLATNDHRYPNLGLGARPDWKQSALFLVNYVNFQFDSNFMNLKQANEFFEQARRQTPGGRGGGSQYLFMSLRPTKKTDIDSMSLEESEVYYSNLAKVEKKFYDEQVQWLKTQPNLAGCTWNLENEKVLGVQNAVASVQQKVRDELKNAIPRLAIKIEGLLASKRVEVKALEKQRDILDPAQSKEMVKHFVADFKDHFQRSIQGQEVRVRSSCAYRARTSFIYSAEKFGLTFAEEYKRTPYGDKFGEWNGFIPIEELESANHLGKRGQQLGDMLGRKLLGVSAFERTLRIFEYMLLARNFENVTDDDIYNAAHKGGAASHFPSNDVVMQIAVRQLNEATQGVEWLCAFIHQHFSQHAADVFFCLVESDAYRLFPLGVKHLLEEEVLGEFTDLLKRRLEQAMKQYEDLVATFDARRPVDKMWKQLMLHLVLSLRDMVPPKDVAQPQSGSPCLGDAHAEAPVGLVDNFAKWFQPPEKQGLDPSSKEAGDHAEPTPWNVHLSIAFRKVAAHMEQFEGQFNFADLVAPGLQQVYPQDWNMINYDYLRRCARKYYCAFVIELMESIHRIWNTEFLDYLTSDHRDELGRDLACVAEEVVKLPEEKWIDAMGGQDPADIEAQIAELQSGIEDLESSLRSLNRGASGTRGEWRPSSTKRGVKRAQIATSDTAPPGRAGRPRIGSSGLSGEADAGGMQAEQLAHLKLEIEQLKSARESTEKEKAEQMEQMQVTIDRLKREKDKAEREAASLKFAITATRGS